jgi:membrane associated rhomboid family serine protease
VIPVRDENPTRIVPVVTYAILGLVVLAFLWQVSLPARGQKLAVYAFGMIPASLLGEVRLPPELALVPPAATVVTSMFLHGGWLHLLGNLLYLWIFGNNVEEAMGHLRFALFYLLTGTVAAFAQALPDPSSTVPVVGASGALSGVLGAYLVLYPHARVLVWLPFAGLVHMAAALVLGLWFLIQVLASSLPGDSEGGIAFMAHIGGFVAGMVLVPLFRCRGVPLWSGRR